ncbi:HK97 gp10 family phage protein [Clostridium butyricum]|uniref:HK97 gp10 family phage protein n=1 Tax=Clostridium butyricum TaxID=1492 RepID=UPI002ABE04EE|nr:HK97 gp10 family phage protein [Clostridium butyricum]
MSDGFIVTDLENFSNGLIGLANETMPKECKKFVNTQGLKLRQVTVKVAKSKVKKKTGNYYKAIKKGKVYKYKGNGAWAIRVIGKNHANLIEKGHRIVNKKGQEVGFAKKFNVFESAEKDFESTFNSNVENFIDEVLSKGL